MDVAETDGTLAPLASTWSADNATMTDLPRRECGSSASTAFSSTDFHCRRSSVSCSRSRLGNERPGSSSSP